MTIALYALGILLMVIGLGISIALHEIGHLVPAKLFGVRVTQYMIGFGPTLWSKVRGETEYGIKAIPLGGYIRMIGMFPPRKGEDPHTIREDSTGFLQQMSEEAKEWDTSQYSEEDKHRTFVALSVPKKLVVMLGGPFMNLLISVVLATVLIVGMGSPTVTSQIRSVSTCVIPANESQDRSCEGMPAAPAAEAGLQPGDTVKAINGQAISTFDELSMIVREHPGEALTLLVDRQGRHLELTATPLINRVVARDANGVIQTDANGELIYEEAGFLGVTGQPGYRTGSIGEVPGHVWQMFTGTAKVVLTLPVRLWDIAKAAFSSEERDPNGPMGVVGVSRLAGEVVAADQPGFHMKEKAWTLVSVLTSLNMALFVFNLIPLMPLDGGHVAGALYEAIRRFFAKLRKKADPGPVDMSRMLPVTNVVALFFIVMSLLLVYADIVKPVTLF